MPVKELGSQFQFASWRVPQFRRAIEYPLEVMEEIRAFACDELLQLSHAGDEVGGVLFGTRREDLVRILTWRPIACEHTQGAGLRLSSNDRMNLAVQLEMARQNPDLRDLRPIGWFVSHAREGVSLSASDLEIYNGFFPESWQVALVISPKGSGRAEAGFFQREAEDKVQSEASYQCFDLQPLRLGPIATSSAHAAPVAASPVASSEASEPETVRAAHGLTPETAAIAEPVPIVPAREPAVHESPKQAAPPPEPMLRPEPRTFAPLPVKPIQRVEPPAPLLPIEPVGRREHRIPAPAALDIPVPTPSFQIEEELPTRERWLWAIPIALALGIAGFMLYQRHTPPANGSLALRAATEAQTVQLAWDANSRVVRDADRGEIRINDGAKSSQIALNSDQLHAGKMSYVPQSSDVGFTMTIYPANGDPIHDYTRVISPSVNAPMRTAEPAPPPPVPASQPVESAPAPPSADQAALQREVQQLKEDLSKERQRADELQNVVRILENRLGIAHEVAPKAKRRR